MDNGDIIICGLVGVAGKINNAQEKAFKTLLILNSLRGEDSTGICFVNRQDESLITKAIGSPFELFNDNRFTKALNRINKVLIGHGRWATQGEVNKANAHPFETPNLIGVHNGTLKNKHALNRAGDFKTDSEALYNHMDELGMDDVLKTMDGAWALIWWDKANNKLNFLRNKERPLFIAYGEDNETIYWASEKWMLTVALGRHDIKFQEPEELPADYLYTFGFKEVFKIDEPVIVEAKGTYEHKPFNHGNFQGNWMNRKHGVHGVNSTKTAEVFQLQIPHQQPTVSSKGGEVLVGKPLSKISSATKVTYSGVKNRLFEVLALNKNAFGADYLICFDPLERHLPVRLYTNKGDDFDKLVGGEIIGNIAGVVESATEGEYFKILHSSVRVEKGPEPDVETTGKYLNEVAKYYSHAGKLLTKKEWETRYNACSWCTIKLNAEDKNLLTTGGDCLCPGCSGDSEVLSYVTPATRQNG